MKSITVRLLPVMLIVAEAPNRMILLFVEVVSSAAAVNVLLLPVLSKFPREKVNAPVVVKSSTMLKIVVVVPRSTATVQANVTPAVVTLHVLAPASVNVTVPVCVHATLLVSVNAVPATVKVPVPATVIAVAGSMPVVLSVKQAGFVPSVTVKSLVPVFELASKMTASAVVGADAPDAPPEEADQLVVPVDAQVPEPPTQYLFAIG